MSRTVYCDYNGNEIEPPKADPVSMTNGDRIRAMTNEELAKMMEDNGDCPPRACPYDEVAAYITRKECEICWVEWLKEEVSE